MSRAPSTERKRLDRAVRAKEQLRKLKRVELTQAMLRREEAERLAHHTAESCARAAERVTRAQELSAGELMARTLEFRVERSKQRESNEHLNARRHDEMKHSAEVLRATGEMRALDRRRESLVLKERRARDRAEQALLDELAGRLRAKS